MLSLRLFRVRLSTTRLWQVCNITIISTCFMLLRVTFSEKYTVTVTIKKICKTSLVSLCWWSTLFISIEQNVMVSLHLPLPTIYITINKTKWFGLGSSSVGEMIVPRHTKIVRVRTHWKRAHAERSYKVNKGVLRHVKTIDLARTLVMKRREREKHSLTNMSSPFFLGRFVSPLLRLELLLSNFQI